MLEIVKKLQKKRHLNIRILALILVSFSAYAEPCEECNRVRSDLAKEMNLKQSFVTLKAKNEDYLKKPDVAASAAIKVKSNIMLLGIKIETQDNKITLLQEQQKKLNGCTNCPLQTPEKS